MRASKLIRASLSEEREPLTQEGVQRLEDTFLRHYVAASELDWERINSMDGKLKLVNPPKPFQDVWVDCDFNFWNRVAGIRFVLKYIIVKTNWVGQAAFNVVDDERLIGPVAHKHATILRAMTMAPLD